MSPAAPAVSMRTSLFAERVNFAQSVLPMAWMLRFCVWPPVITLAVPAVSSGSNESAEIAASTVTVVLVRA